MTPSPGRPRFVIELEAGPPREGEPSAERRLARLLKDSLRRHNLVACWCQEVPQGQEIRTCCAGVRLVPAPTEDAT